MLDNFEQLRPYFGFNREEFLIMQGAEPASMARTLDAIAREYGAIEGYLQSIGLSEMAIERAREQLLE